MPSFVNECRTHAYFCASCVQHAHELITIAWANDCIAPCGLHACAYNKCRSHRPKNENRHCNEWTVALYGQQVLFFQTTETQGDRDMRPSTTPNHKSHPFVTSHESWYTHPEKNTQKQARPDGRPPSKLPIDKSVFLDSPEANHEPQQLYANIHQRPNKGASVWGISTCLEGSSV